MLEQLLFRMLFTWLFFCCLFSFLKHPLAIGIVLLCLSLLVASYVVYLNVMTWVSYALVLILLGGLLVIFIYVCLSSTNELFDLLGYKLGLVLTRATSLFACLGWVAKMNSEENEQLRQVLENKTRVFFEPWIESQSSGLWLEMLFREQLGVLTLLLVGYLLLSLVVVVTITKATIITLRSIYVNFSN